MKVAPISISISTASLRLLAWGALSATLAAQSVQATRVAADVPRTPTPLAIKNFEQVLDRTENLQLPLNKVVLYREAATALIPTDKPQATLLLKRALADIDSAEAAMKVKGTLDEKTYQHLEFFRLPVLMLMERFNPAEALNILMPPQTADRDLAFYTLFFGRLKSPELVRQAAMRKMDYGLTPAVVAAYGLLKVSSPEIARSLGTAIVLRLTKCDPENDPMAVSTAFYLVHQLRTDVGALAPQMTIDPNLLSPDSVRDLFSFIGDAFLASKDPEDLILGSRPQLFIDALAEYAPAKAQDVKLLAFAAPDATSKIFGPDIPVYDANHPDPKTLTPEQVERRAAAKAQIEAQIEDSNQRIKVLAATASDETLPQKTRDAAAFESVAEANKGIAMARAQATVLDSEAFSDGEVEFYNLNQVTLLIDHVSLFLQRYALIDPVVATDAARNLDGNEVQTQVALGIAIREMTGSQPYLVPPDKPPVKGQPVRPIVAQPPPVPTVLIDPATM